MENSKIRDQIVSRTELSSSQLRPTRLVAVAFLVLSLSAVLSYCFSLTEEFRRSPALPQARVAVTDSENRNLTIREPLNGRRQAPLLQRTLPVEQQVSGIAREAKSRINQSHVDGHLKRSVSDGITLTKISRAASETKSVALAPRDQADGDSVENDDYDQSEEARQGTRESAINANDTVEGSDSVSIESSSLPLLPLSDDNEGQSSGGYEDDDMRPPQPLARRPANSRTSSKDDSADNELDQSFEENDENDPMSVDQSQSAQDDEVAMRREQEAAEASEAEAADRSALDEQQQAQREIILAQAQSEAKAIKEQQEALLKLQQLQQQILLRRHQSDLVHDEDLRGRKKIAGGYRDSNRSNKQNSPFKSSSYKPNKHSAVRKQSAPLRREGEFYESSTTRQQHLTPFGGINIRHTKQLPKNAHQMDIQFSDHPDHDTYTGKKGRNLNEADSTSDVTSKRANLRLLGNAWDLSSRGRHDLEELGVEHSVKQSQHVTAPTSQPSSFVSGIKFNSTHKGDLLAAAQHHYGPHYGTLQGYSGIIGSAPHGGFYQYAESKKKGQYESGFKRGGKKFYTSGHSSQLKSHAEGHVKWSAKKGKGSHTWDLKHKNKGHYGAGDKISHGDLYSYY